MAERSPHQLQETPSGVKRSIELFYLWINYLVLSTLPTDGVGLIWGSLFKIPLFFYKIGLGPLIGDKILILTTTGRKTGLARKTPLEYTYALDRNTYTLTAAWGGTSDWFRNLVANPNVHIQVGSSVHNCQAQLLPSETVIAELKPYVQHNPFAQKMFSRWIGQPFDGSEENYQKVAAFMPMIDLHPLEN